VEVDVLITETDENLIVDVISHGIPFRKKSSQSCLKLSKRKNSQNISGSGLGLRIVKEFLNITMLKLFILLREITQ
jgi:signal transduction histidine kinase